MAKKFWRAALVVALLAVPVVAHAGKPKSKPAVGAAPAMTP